jgi:hypothetical protein
MSSVSDATWIPARYIDFLFEMQPVPAVAYRSLLLGPGALHQKLAGHGTASSSGGLFR